jgi:DNA-binding NtrC family response regulator
MSAAQKFLIIDDNADSRFLLTKTLIRKFPTALLIECADTGTALIAAENEKPAAIVVHRTGETSGLDLIPLLRAANHRVPIVMVSGIDRTTEAMAAGATCFLNYDEWLRIGSVVAGLLTFANHAAATASHASTEHAVL